MTPECAQNLLKKYGTDNWYDWAIRNWGCKWDASMSDSIEDDDYEFRFETPWSIPEEFIKTFALKAYKKCPNSSFTWWWEEEQGFGQEFFIESGEIIVKKNWDMPSFDEYNIIAHLISGEERHIKLTKVSGGDPDRYGNGGWYVDDNESCYHETAWQALESAVSQQIVRIDNIDGLAETLKELIQKKIA